MSSCHSCPGGVTVVLADGDPEAGGELRTQLCAEPGITVVAEAATSREVARETVHRRPDVVILDPELDQHTGIAMIKELLRSAPGTAVLGYSSSAEAGWVSAVMRAGARGYVLKTAEPDDIVRAIRSVAAGEVIFGAHVATDGSTRSAASPAGNARCST